MVSNKRAVTWMRRESSLNKPRIWNNNNNKKKVLKHRKNNRSIRMWIWQHIGGKLILMI